MTTDILKLPYYGIYWRVYPRNHENTVKGSFRSQGTLRVGRQNDVGLVPPVLVLR